MGDSQQKNSKFFFQLAGVSAIVLVCVPLASLIFSGLIRVDWPTIGTIAIFAGVGIVVFLGIGGIAAIFEDDK